MAQTADVERAATETHPLPPTPVSEEVKDADWSQKDSAEVRPGTPNSIGNDLDFSHNREVSESSMQHSPPTYSGSTKRKPVPASISQSNGRGPEVRLQEAPASPVSISPAHIGILEPERASILMDGDSDSFGESDADIRPPVLLALPWASVLADRRRGGESSAHGKATRQHDPQNGGRDA